jgi:hypothetical protein
MKRSRSAEAQTVGCLQEAGAYDARKPKCRSRRASDLTQLEALEAENARLRRLHEGLTIENRVLRELLQRCKI